VSGRHVIERMSAALLGALLLHAGAALAADPEGVVFNAAMETYTVDRVPTRSLDAVLKSFESWRHQVLADASTADYAAEDGILSMECSACGQSRPSAIEIGKIDLKSVMAYHAGTWNIGIRSSDGTQDFRGLLRGEIGSGPHEPARVNDNKRLALTALQDLYDLGYLTQNPDLAATLRDGGAPKAVAKTAARPPAPAKPAAVSIAALASETAYAARARLQLLAGEVDAALQTLATARQKFGRSPVLRDLEAHYVVIGDAYDRLRWGVKLDVPGVQSYLRQIPTLEPADAKSIEAMLAQTLSHRIADQRTAGRDTIADELLTSGRSLFPDFADLLTQGKAGALPTGGIEVGTATPAEKDAR
jgi:hypothetical protein